MSIDLIKRVAERLVRERMSSSFDSLTEPPEPGEAPTQDQGAEYDWFGRVAEEPRHAAERSGHLRPRREIVLDACRLEQAGIAVPQARVTRLAEELRIIMRPVIRTALAEGAESSNSDKLVMVTSAKPGEGKSFLAANLAMSIAAEKNITVILIDTDFQNPSISRAMGLDGERGLLDLLADPQIDLPDVMLQTNFDNLIVVAAGRVTSHATELLSSARMSAFAGQIVEEPSCIAVFDAAPLLTCSEPAALAFHVGQAILVVQAERTNRRSIDEAIAFLRPCRHVGLVLNKALRHPGADGFALQARGAHQDVAGT